MMLLEQFRSYSRHCQRLCCRALAYLVRPACRTAGASTTTARCLRGLSMFSPGLSPRTRIQVSARERGIPLLDGVFPARAENPNRRHRLRTHPRSGARHGVMTIETELLFG